MGHINFEEILDKTFEKNLKRSIYELKDSKTVTLEAMKEVWNKAIETTARVSNHPDAFYESDTWWIPLDSILKLKV